MIIQNWLQLAAAAQLGIAAVNLSLVRVMKWEKNLERMPLLMREVFWVHTWFISVTLTIFAMMTLRFSSEMAKGSNISCAWLAASIGIFWAIRVVIQFAWYSPEHWRGQVRRTLIHLALVLLYTSISAVYLAASVKGDKNLSPSPKSESRS